MTITVIHDLLVSVAEEMGEALVGAASSPNIKERRDSSCALFDAGGNMVAQASHIPVHLGSLASSVIESMRLQPGPGDMILLNDPYRGGAHLPDLTLVAPVFAPIDGDGDGETAAAAARPSWYVANRAHHADVGGMAPGSLPPATEIFQEGLIVPPVRLVRGGVLDEDLLNLILANTRTPDERRADLLAQVGANKVGIRRLEEILGRSGGSQIGRQVSELMAYSEARVGAVINAIPEGEWRGDDVLDDDGAGTSPVRLRVCLRRRGEFLEIDFSGSAHQVTGNVNAVETVTRSAVLYVLCALAGEELPVNAGCLARVRLILPERSVVNASHPAAVAAGNVETSQRIVDVLLRALAPVFPDRIPAASQGTMNNVMFGGVVGITGPLPVAHEPDAPAAAPASRSLAPASRAAAPKPFAYYETIAGGMGAGPAGPGMSAVQCHMTNTRNTPVEALERDLPVRMTRYAVRRGSGGHGHYRGGDGVIREFMFLAPVVVSLHTERRLFPPYGLNGGAPGAPGRNTRVMPDGRFIEVPGKVLYNAEVGEKLIIETPGGGGYGTPIPESVGSSSSPLRPGDPDRLPDTTAE